MSTNVTSELALRYAFDDATQSFKTIPGEATSFEIELNHGDGDSIHSMSKKDVAVNAELDVSDKRTVCLFISAGTSTVVLQASPESEGDSWFDVYETSANMSKPTASSVITVCAMRVRVVASVDVSIVAGS